MPEPDDKPIGGLMMLPAELIEEVTAIDAPEPGLAEISQQRRLLAHLLAATGAVWHRGNKTRH